MVLNMSQNEQLNAKQLTLISLGAMVLGHMMLTTILPNEILNLLGLIITAYFIFYHTLRKNDVFSYIIVIYFCSLFPYLSTKGGGFNMINLVCLILYYSKFRKMPFEKKNSNKWLLFLIGLFFLSSALGWAFLNTGSKSDLIYSIVSFTGIVFLLLTSSGLIITANRIKIFLQINLVLIIYSTIASLNKYLHIITFKTPMMPVYGLEGGYFEGGGIIGSSPLYGEHSMILVILFSVFLIVGNKMQLSPLLLSLGVTISFLNVFMSISRSVFMLSLVGIFLIYLFQFMLSKINISKQFAQIILIGFLGFGTLWVVKQTGLGYVFDRVDEIEERNNEEGGVTIDRIIDGSAFNRKTAFDEGYKRYDSKDSWLIGYGWGIGGNNRDAYFVNTSINRNSAHSQIFAVLFLFGWLGFIGYFGIIILLIYKSYRQIGNSNINMLNRVFSFFFFIAFILFLFNEIKADSVSMPNYFGSTIIIIGLGFSNLNNKKEYLNS